MTIEFSRQIFEKYPNINFYKNLSSGTRVVSYRQTDGRTDGLTHGHEEANSRFSQFYEPTYKNCED